MSIDWNYKCRTCLSELNTYYQIFDNVEENFNIIDMLDSVVPQIKIRNPSQFSSLICQMCVEKLYNSYKFQQMCLETNDTLNISLGIAMLKMHPCLDQLFDPLATDANVIKAEVGEYAFLASALPPEETYEHRLPTHEFDSDGDLRSLGLPDQEYTTSLKDSTLQRRSSPKSFEEQDSLLADNRIHQIKGLANKNDQNVDLVKLENSSNDALTKKKGKLESKINYITENVIRSKIYRNKSTKHFIYPCKACGKLFHTVTMLDRHTVVHSPSKPYGCEICKYRFMSAEECRYHFLKHRIESAKEKFAASLPEAIDSMIKCATNIINQQPEDKMYKCNYCRRVYNLHDRLIIHINKFHDIFKKPSCRMCGKLFTSVYMLREHMPLHNRKDFEFQLLDVIGFETKLALQEKDSHSQTFLGNASKNISDCRYPLDDDNLNNGEAASIEIDGNVSALELPPLEWNKDHLPTHKFESGEDSSNLHLHDHKYAAKHPTLERRCTSKSSKEQYRIENIENSIHEAFAKDEENVTDSIICIDSSSSHIIIPKRKNMNSNERKVRISEIIVPDKIIS